MTKEHYVTKKYSGIDRFAFGGIIYASDFNTGNIIGYNTKGSPLASRIISDNRFDNMCRIKAENRDK